MFCKRSLGLRRRLRDTYSRNSCIQTEKKIKKLLMTKILFKVTKKDILYERKKNSIAKDLMTPKYKIRVIKPKKGKGSFKRKKTKNII